MKLIFRKNQEEQVEVYIRKGTAEDQFSYIEMIKSLIANNEFEETEFDDSLTEPEKTSINAMLEKINKVVAESIESADKTKEE